MNETSRKILNKLTKCFLMKNYNYTYLKAMLIKGKQLKRQGSTLITGSSYALSGIVETVWNNAVNSSCSSQDLYYDFRCAREVISVVPPNTFSKCFIVKGYYAACHDLSKSKKEREKVITDVYYPLFQDAHNWQLTKKKDLFEAVIEETNTELTDGLKELIEECALDIMINYGTYYNPLRIRDSNVFNFGEKKWNEISIGDREDLCKYRAQIHNKLFDYKDTLEENKEIFKDYIRFLHANNVLPIYVIPPFMPTYTKNILPEMKDSLMELFKAASGEIHFVDFNQSDCFNEFDFADTDHLSEIGAQKMSRILTEMFGK